MRKFLAETETKFFKFRSKTQNAEIPHENL